jgi:hypothetical protein
MDKQEPQTLVAVVAVAVVKPMLATVRAVMVALVLS